MQLITGLGNPGRQYETSPHNIGFRTLDRLLTVLGANGFQHRFHGDFQKVSENGNTTLLLKPATFMNRSGLAVAECARFFKIPAPKILVVSDDLDLPAGRARMRQEGGHGGHNGLRSIIEHLGTDRFLRARIGIGRPQSKEHVVGHVLGKLNEQQARLCELAMEKVTEALVRFVHTSEFQNTSFTVIETAADPAEKPEQSNL